MSYDVNFDQARLDQLAEQYLTNSKAGGRVFFLSDSDDNRLDHARWQLDDADHDALKSSGFKFHLMELLNTLLVNTLLVYRAQQNQPNASQGVVQICNDELIIEWLSKDEFEARREEPVV